MLWRAFLPDRSRAPERRGGAVVPSTLETIRAWPSPEAKRWVFAFAKRICPEANTRALIAIGSIVREPAAVYDADLIYIYRTHRPDLSDHPIDVDVRIYGG